MRRKAQVFLTFDVEDPVTPASDDAVVWLADLLREKDVNGAFFLTGDKARALRQRQRLDVFEALRGHDVGYHTNHHSTHPTVAEYLEPHGWADGVAEVVRRELSGADLIRELSGRQLCGFATAGTSWGPHVPGALAALGIPAHVHSFSRTGGGHNPHWYAGALCFARSEAVGPVEDDLQDQARFAELLGRLPQLIKEAAESEDRILHLYVGHPTIFVNQEFWDGLNYASGRNPEPGVALTAPRPRSSGGTRTMLDNLALLIDTVQASPDAEFVAFSDLVAARRTEPTFREGWFTTALAEAAKTDDIRTTSRTVSPAQLLHAVCRAVQGEDVNRSGPGGDVLGPVELPKPGEPVDHPAGLDHEQLRAVAASVRRTVAATGTLPAVARADGIAVPVATLYRSLLEFTARGGADVLRALPETVPLTAGTEFPWIADEISEHYGRRVRRWMHRPDLDVTELMRLTRAQTWSLRATASG
ncbi:polysaccharide deacetylase family protein [Streptomyces sp. SID8352]|uniref:polysaccharide deacetylase family protein n=1 Tax=Streptomyces sp. SID8352 TaxID=2690338 RepID=UPI00137014CD|nr:polysaccharide deacetylase family protein [Streptomyces sp. SID8352]MYU23650.1 hypothetical protein [Streptomyces sp. SID8352]